MPASRHLLRLYAFPKERPPRGVVGIYEVTHKASGRSYIGQAKCVTQRWEEHYYRGLRRSHFHSALRKYGAEAFSWRVLAICDLAELDARETEFIAKHGTMHPYGFNHVGGGSAAHVRSEAFQKRLKQVLSAPEELRRKSAATRKTLADPKKRAARVRQLLAARRAVAINDPPAWLRKVDAEREASGLPVYAFIGPWRGSQGKTIWRCNRHGEYTQAPSSYQQGQGCPVCRYERMSAKLRVDPVVWKKVADERRAQLGLPVHARTGGWIHTHAKTTWRCPKHGEYKQTPHGYLRSNGCQECKKQLLADKFRADPAKWLASVNKERRSHGLAVYEFIGPYVKAGTPATWRCAKHGEYPQTPNAYQQGHGCPVCGNERKGSTRRVEPEAWKREVDVKRRAAGLPIYSFVGEWKGTREPLDARCDVHGEFRVSPGNYAGGKGCKQCGRERTAAASRKGPEEWLREANAIRRKNGRQVFEYVGPWAGVAERTVWRCRIHGQFELRPRDYRSRCGCPKCGHIAKAAGRAAALWDAHQRNARREELG